MKNRSLYLTLLSLGGVLFAGYLSATKLFAGTCPLNEGCPLFLGQPACYTGFVLFASLLILSLFKKQAWINRVSFVGILFSLYSTYKDLMFPSCPGGRCHYSLLIPTCIYGLFMYLGLFVLSLKNKKKEAHE